MKPVRILLLGSGGREHAIAWKISQSSLCEKLFIAPGNAGTETCGENVNISYNDFLAVQSLCLREHIELVIVGPEEPLVNGIYDYFRSDAALRNIALIGPSQYAAQLEGSKAFAKAFMQRHNIPTASYREFDLTNYEEGVAYLRSLPIPIVLKADGLAGGKGVIICQNHVEAMAEFELMIQQSKFGEAGKKVVVEEFLKGIELSMFALVDGKSYVLLPEAKDYKRIGEGDTGLNTGGMGAVSPVPFADGEFMKKVKERVIEPTVRGLQQENFEYKGFVFFGLINVNGEPFVIEYNCRMGDPETEVVIPRLQNDLVELFLAASQQRLSEIEVKIDPRAAATVVAVSGGYPGNYEKGFEIDGLEILKEDDVIIFHAGTARQNDVVVTNGGRVLAVTSFGDTVTKAARRSSEMMEFLDFHGIYYRRDIGYEFV
ncbi:MAG TPA: phosphoribosylamine--glycine ligase [Chitinophagaceae bacterium]|nr:phosphoribosylamine--glycine ligase [Chitinophagaceae bacterium]